MSEIKLLEHRVKACEKRIEKLEESNADMTDVKISIQKLTDVSKNLVDAVKSQNDRITAIEQKPLKRLEKVESAMLAKVGTVIGLILIMGILIAVVVYFALRR